MNLQNSNDVSRSMFGYIVFFKACRLPFRQSQSCRTRKEEIEVGKKTPLYEKHISLGVVLLISLGWALPVQYSGIVDEHLAVRTRPALASDVSHMGGDRVKGKDALEVFITTSLLNDVFLDLGPGKIHRTAPNVLRTWVGW